MATILIRYEIPYEELIKKNGLETCLEIVPGTRRYITHTKQYGKKENTKWVNLFDMKR